MVTGRIHSVETFGTVDGPGIRYVLFMQGCAMRCAFCHNRDSWDINVIKDIQSFLPFMKFSGGGITATGGEPLLQPQFLTEVFRRVREIGLNTVLDTSGYAKLETVKELITVTDLVIVSIKHPDEEKHKEISGVSFDRVKKFLDYLSEINKPIWVRYVIIPGITDKEEDLEKLINMLKKYKNIQLVEILPYNTLGIFKWEDLGLDYPLKGISSPDKKHINEIKERFARNGFSLNFG